MVCFSYHRVVEEAKSTRSQKQDLIEDKDVPKGSPVSSGSKTKGRKLPSSISKVLSVAVSER
jgi:hypothetical protein